MAFSKHVTLSLAFLSFLIFSLLMQRTTFASGKSSYIVYLGDHSHGPQGLDDDFIRATKSHYELLETHIGRQKAKEALIYSYTKHINGFAAILDAEEAAQIARNPKVISVFMNKGRKLHTTRSWEFLGLEKDGVIESSSTWEKARYGEDTIIGNLDGGVWPESKSFSDEGLGPIPSRWKGTCENSEDPTFHCNRKLIGARYFNKGYASVVGKNVPSFNTPRDIDGHGTHTLSTAGGHFVPNANVFGFGNGTAKGGSPRARVAAYKVCYAPTEEGECFDADILAAFDAAIYDGVHILSVSLGGAPGPFFSDGVAIGSFHASRHGIVVVCSAGNSGPNDGSVSNVAPWQITVGASTMDRLFPSYIVLGNNMQFMGESLSSEALEENKFFPIISAADAKATNASMLDALVCKAGALDPKKATGKILVCLRGSNGRIEKGYHASLVGAVGMVLTNDITTGNEILADSHVLPATHIGYRDGDSVFSYINHTTSPVAYITRPTTQLGTKPAPFMAAFSSRGPNTLTPEILKPDITAPGVNVLAAYTEAVGPSNGNDDKRRVQFNLESGTSMSCPHISGVAGLLKTLYPSWSPAAIKSAIMTTARTYDNLNQHLKDSFNNKTTPFSYGAGHVDPNRAMDPGLVFDLTPRDYLRFICSLGYNQTQIAAFAVGPFNCPKSINLSNFNYPSITVPNLKGSMIVTRTVRNVGLPGTYRVSVQGLDGVYVSIWPKILKFDKVGEEKRFKVELKAKKGSKNGDYVFGDMTWTDGKHYVRSPIVVKAVI